MKSSRKPNAIPGKRARARSEDRRTSFDVPQMSNHACQNGDNVCLEHCRQENG
jgi:hypothetical protein